MQIQTIEHLNHGITYSAAQITPYMFADVFHNTQERWSIWLDLESNHIEMHLLYLVHLISANMFFIKSTFLENVKRLLKNLEKYRKSILIFFLEEYIEKYTHRNMNEKKNITITVCLLLIF